jgi:hypothetical protein
MSGDDEECSERPSTSTKPENIPKVREAIVADRRRTINYVCAIVGMTYGSAQRVLSDDLDMTRIAAKCVPRLLSNDLEEHGVAVCTELKDQVRNDPNFISKVIAGDESCVYGYDPEAKQHSS